MENTLRYIIIAHGLDMFRCYAVRDTITGFIVKQGFPTIYEAGEFIKTLVRSNTDA